MVDDPETDFAVFEDQRIRMRGDMVNLTDMWMANDRPENKRPGAWKRLPSTVEFRDKLKTYLRPQSAVQKSHITFDETLFETVRGQRAETDENGTTWAHWQLALVYAHYLSPEFYIWCNCIVRNFMTVHGSLMPSGKPAHITFQENFNRLERRFDILAQYALDNLLLASAIQQTPGKRLAFTTRSRRIIRAVTQGEPFGGLCPCCGRAPVIGELAETVANAEFDHFYGPALNRPEHGWLICQQCHDDFTEGSPLLRFGAIPRFHAFQGQVLDYLLTNKSA